MSVLFKFYIELLYRFVRVRLYGVTTGPVLVDAKGINHFGVMVCHDRGYITTARKTGICGTRSKGALPQRHPEHKMRLKTAGLWHPRTRQNKPRFRACHQATGLAA